MGRNLLFWAVSLAFIAAVPLQAEDRFTPESVSVPGVDPIPPAAKFMSEDELEHFFNSQKKGMPVELTLEKGKRIKGLFSSYDDYYETVWIVPRKGETGVFNQQGYKLGGIRRAVVWDVKAENSASGFAVLASTSPNAGLDDYYLLKKEDTH